VKGEGVFQKERGWRGTEEKGSRSLLLVKDLEVEKETVTAKSEIKLDTCKADGPSANVLKKWRERTTIDRTTKKRSGDARREEEEGVPREFC